MQNLEDEIALKIKQSLQNKDINNNNLDGKIQCDYCGSYYELKNNTRCPNCGARNTYKGNNNG